MKAVVSTLCITLLLSFPCSLQFSIVDCIYLCTSKSFTRANNSSDKFIFFENCMTIVLCGKINPGSLTNKPECRSDSYFWIHEFRNKDHFNINHIEVILISEFLNSDHFNIQGFLPGWQAVGVQDFIPKNL